MEVQVDFDPKHEGFAERCVTTMNGMSDDEVDKLCKNIIEYYKWDHNKVELEPFNNFPAVRDVTKCFHHIFLHASPLDLLTSTDLMMTFLSDSHGPDVGVLCYINNGRILYAGTSDAIDIHNVESLDVEWNLAPRPIKAQDA